MDKDPLYRDKILQQKKDYIRKKRQDIEYIKKEQEKFYQKNPDLNNDLPKLFEDIYQNFFVIYKQDDKWIEKMFYYQKNRDKQFQTAVKFIETRLKSEFVNKIKYKPPIKPE